MTELRWRNSGPFTCGVFIAGLLQFSIFQCTDSSTEHTFAAGLLCRAWAPGIPSQHIPCKHIPSRVPISVQGALGSHGCTLFMACHEEEPMWLSLWVWRAEVFAQQPEHPEQACLEEWGTNVWAKGGLGLEAQTETDRSWKQTHRSTSACLCSAKRHLQSLDHDGCNLLCWNFSIHRLTVQCRRVIYLMCTYHLQCPSNHLPFPSSLHSMNLFVGIFHWGKKSDDLQNAILSIKAFLVRLSFKGYGLNWKWCHAVLFAVQSKIPECTESLWLLFCF